MKQPCRGASGGSVYSPTSRGNLRVGGVGGGGPPGRSHAGDSASSIQAGSVGNRCRLIALVCRIGPGTSCSFLRPSGSWAVWELEPVERATPEGIRVCTLGSRAHMRCASISVSPPAAFCVPSGIAHRLVGGDGTSRGERARAPPPAHMCGLALWILRAAALCTLGPAGVLATRKAASRERPGREASPASLLGLAVDSRGAAGRAAFGPRPAVFGLLPWRSTLGAELRAVSLGGAAQLRPPRPSPAVPRRARARVPELPEAWRGLLVDTRPLGAGNFGRVTASRAVGSDCEVAVKAVTPTSRSALTWVEREIEAHRRFSGGHFITYLGSVWSDTNPRMAFIATEVATCDLTTLLRNRSLSFNTRLRFFLEIAGGVVEMARAGFVHRDLKLNNILVVGDCDSPEACSMRIADFGCTRSVLSEHSPADDVIFGSPCHIAPEVYLGQSDGKAQDVWALGMLLYELATMELPAELSGKKGSQIADLVVRDFDISMDPVFQKLKETEPSVAGLIQAMLHRDLYRRISAAQSLEMAEKIANDRGISVPSPQSCCVPSFLGSHLAPLSEESTRSSQSWDWLGA